MRPSDEIEPKARDEWIDWLRIESAIAIILLHITTREKVRLFDTIGVFDWWVISCYETWTRLAVPIFFMISGSLIISRCGTVSPWKYVLPKAKRIALVLLIWTLLYGFWEYLKRDVSSPLALLARMLVGEAYFHLWFLLALIGCYLSAPILRLCTETWVTNRFFVGCLVPLTVSFDFALSALFSSRGYFNTSLLAICVPYIAIFYSGYLCSGSKPLNRKNAVLVLFSALIAALLSFGTLRHFGYTTTYEKVLVPLSPLIIVASISFFVLVQDLHEQLPPIPAFMKLLARDCVGIYLVHPVPLDVMNHLGFLGRTPNLLVGIPMLTLVVLVASVIIVQIIRASKTAVFLFP